MSASEDRADYREARRRRNEATARAAAPPLDAQGLVELSCECAGPDCERSVKLPLDVYRRMVEDGNQYLVQTGHHAFDRYRTIVRHGLTTIEERRA